mmetsp:Transcript_8077/g.10581  ORF Transcript_8077/g.10581 Transcript_8077/m.10581 type:complete len:177 (-) Transcript_8077:1330-1860(-)
MSRHAPVKRYPLRLCVGSYVVMLMTSCVFHVTNAFVVNENKHHPSSQRLLSTLLLSTSKEQDDAPTESKEFFDDFTWRAEKIRLEEENTKQFLKRRPIKLPYEDARRWVQANLGPDTKEEFMDLVANGNLRTPYIPKSPEDYYTKTKEWISWHHFLTGIFDNQTPSGVRPASGEFD